MIRRKLFAENVFLQIKVSATIRNRIQRLFYDHFDELREYENLKIALMPKNTSGSDALLPKLTFVTKQIKAGVIG